VSLSQILRKLDPTRFETTVLLLRRDAKAIEVLQNAGARVVVRNGLSQFRQVIGGWDLATPLGLYFTLRSVLALIPSWLWFRRLLADLKPDLVYLNALPAFLYAYPAHKAGVPVILHVREIVLKGLLQAWRRMYRRVVERYVHETIYIGEFERGQLGASGRYRVIPNYVDLARWTRCRDVGQAHASPDGGVDEISAGKPPAILFVGGLNPIKGIGVLLPALAILKRRGIPFRWVCLALEATGRPPHGLKRLLLANRKTMSFGEVQAFLAETGLTEQSIFKPFVTDPVPEYLKADVLVFPSTEPHFPRPLVEAGALALPVVASDLPGPQAVVENGVNGLLVPANDPEMLAAALERLLTDRELRIRMGQANYQVVKARYNAAVNEQCILELIEKYTHGAESRGIAGSP
jgi:glycosyltransferase involved in cell wall biosynthesis